MIEFVMFMRTQRINRGHPPNDLKTESALIAVYINEHYKFNYI